MLDNHLTCLAKFPATERINPEKFLIQNYYLDKTKFTLFIIYISPYFVKDFSAILAVTNIHANRDRWY